MSIKDSEYACTVVVRSFNEERHIGRLLEGILKQSLKNVEIILVDSGSTDSTLEVVSAYPVKVLKIPPDQFTFGRSLNLGCEAASAPLIAIASAHVYPVYEDWLERLLEPFSQSTTALVYGMQRGNDSTRFSEHQIFETWFPEQSQTDQQHPFCNNANAAIRKRLWEERPYDEELPGLEDLDWAAWALEQGYSIHYAADALVVHVHEETPRHVYNRYRREAMALSRIRPRERFTLFDLARLYATNVLSDLWHAGHQRKLTRSLVEILWFRWMQFWGTYRGFNIRGPLTGELKSAFYYPRGFNRLPSSPGRNAAEIEYE
jgi:rhamnosyltransferase